MLFSVSFLPLRQPTKFRPSVLLHRRSDSSDRKPTKTQVPFLEAILLRFFASDQCPPRLLAIKFPKFVWRFRGNGPARDRRRPLAYARDLRAWLAVRHQCKRGATSPDSSDARCGCRDPDGRSGVQPTIASPSRAGSDPDPESGIPIACA